MNVIELMDAKASSFSKNDTKIYESIKKFPDNFANNSITEICNETGFTKAALTRFAQKLGFSGFTEFQYQFSKDKDELYNTKVKRLSDIYSDILRRTEDMIDDETIENLAKKILKSNIVYLKGSNLSRLPAEELNIGLRLTCKTTPNFIQEDIDSVHFKTDDVLLIYSAKSGDAQTNICRQLRDETKDRPYAILLTTNAKHPLRHNFNEIIVLPDVPLSESKDAALSDTFSFLLFNELLLRKIQKIIKNK